MQLLDEEDLGERLVGEALAVRPVREQQAVEIGRDRGLGPQRFDLRENVRVVAGQLMRQAFFDAGEILGELERRCKGQIACGHGGCLRSARCRPHPASRRLRPSWPYAARTAISMPMAVISHFCCAPEPRPGAGTSALPRSRSLQIGSTYLSAQRTWPSTTAQLRISDLPLCQGGAASVARVPWFESSAAYAEHAGQGERRSGQRAGSCWWSSFSGSSATCLWCSHCTVAGPSPRRRSTSEPVTNSRSRGWSV